MSVLFKALQKAEKDNEQRQAPAGSAGFDAGRLAGSGAIRLAGGRGLNWRTAGLAVVAVLGLVIMGTFFLVQPPEPRPRPPVPVAAVAPPAAVDPAASPAATPAAPGTPEATAVLQPPPAPTPETAAQTAEAVASSGAPVAQTPANAAAQPAAQPAAAEAAAPEAAQAAPAEAAPPAVKTAEAVAPPARAPSPPPPRYEPMPDIAADSPARMLNPPIAIQRSEFDLSGVGNAVRVREVSQSARDNVGAGYDALVRGAYAMALEFYDRALKEEPGSVLALLGRGAALQKLGKAEDAHTAYEQVLKADPGNREALSNLTVITGERSPSEALNKLLELEKQYPTFSPVKAQIGLTYAKLGSMNEALEYLRRATAISPDSIMYQYNMALVLDHLGRSEQALAVYENVLASLSGGRGAPELSSTEIERRVRFLKTR